MVHSFKEKTIVFFVPALWWLGTYRACIPKVKRWPMGIYEIFNYYTGPIPWKRIWLLSCSVTVAKYKRTVLLMRLDTCFCTKTARLWESTSDMRISNQIVPITINKYGASNSFCSTFLLLFRALWICHFRCCAHFLHFARKKKRAINVPFPTSTAPNGQMWQQP